jgi:hypothetical protein
MINFKKYSRAIVLFGLLAFAFCWNVPKLSAATTPPPVTKKVFVLIFNPIFQGNKTLSVYKGWGNPVTLDSTYITDVKNSSHGYVNYSVVRTQTVNGYPQKASGFRFTNSTYLGCLGNSAPSYCLELIDYKKLITDYNLCGLVNSGVIDEVWLWGGPYFGYYEAVMAGPSAYNTNGTPITGTSCTKSLHIMGFSYERGVSEMLEDLGHRIEGTMDRIYGNFNPTLTTMWNKFAMYDKVLPGQAGCGNIHYPFNGVSDYDWSNTSFVNNKCDDWLNYPSTKGEYKNQNCNAWGCTGYGYKKYWLSHLPYKTGTNNEINNNWWNYVVDFDNAIKPVTNGEKRYQINVGSRDYYTSCGQTVSTWNEIYLGTDPGCTTNNKHTAYLVFPNVQIPKGAAITNAYLEFVADGPYSNTIMESISLTDGKMTTPAVNWPINTPWTFYTIVKTSNIASAVQSLVRSTGWISGSTVTLKINHVSGSGQRRFFAFEREVNASARLVVFVQ